MADEDVSSWLGARRTTAPPAIKFHEIGTTISGRVIAVSLVSDLDFKSKQPRVASNGSEIKIMRVDLSTREGDCALYVRGSWREGSRSLVDAVRSACRAADRDAPEIGDVLRVRRLDDETDGGFRRYCYEARLEPEDG